MREITPTSYEGKKESILTKMNICNNDFHASFFFYFIPSLSLIVHFYSSSDYIMAPNFIFFLYSFSRECASRGYIFDKVESFRICSW